jgi:hypothetical protein
VDIETFIAKGVAAQKAVNAVTEPLSADLVDEAPKEATHDMSLRMPKSVHGWLMDEAHRIRKATGKARSPTWLAEQIVIKYVKSRMGNQ